MLALANAIVVLGAGPLGEKILKSRLKQYVVAVADNDPYKQGTQIEGFTIQSVSDIAMQFGRNVPVVVAIYNHCKPVNDLLEDGFVSVLPYTVFFKCYPDELLPHACLEKPDILPTARINKTRELFEDAQSVDEYDAVLSFLTTPMSLFVSLNCALDPKDIYFDPSIYKISEDDVFVDCGAYTGDTIELLRSKLGKLPRQVIAFEPDKHNYAKLVEAVKYEPNVKVFNSAVGDQEQDDARFIHTGTAGSQIGYVGSGTTQVAKLDSLLSYTVPTVIKMDIEGSEWDAILGASKTIKEHAPILAIVLYHKAKDLWEIPALVHSLNPDYKLYLRRYAQDCWETVLYAVPPHRVLGKDK